MKRDIYWDSLKFVLIFLVVYGHIAPRYLEGSQFNMAIYNFIYMFHMPLFIFVSGRFSHIRDRKKYIHSIFRLFETYLVFQIIRTLLQIVKGEELTLSCFTTPQWTLWYLIVLIYWRLAVLYLPETFLRHRKVILIVSFFISIFAGFVPIDNAFAFQRTFAFLPFFVIGYFSFDIDIRKYIDKVPSFMAVLVLIAVFVFFFFYFGDKDLVLVHHCKTSFWSYDFHHTVLRFVARCIYVPTAIFLSLFVMRLVPTNKMLAKWGSVTLFIFIYHTFAINVLLELTKRGYVPQNELLLFVYAGIITFGLLYLSHFKPLNILLNPVSYYRNYRKLLVD